MVVFPESTAPASLPTGEPKPAGQFDAPQCGSVGNLTRVGIIWRAVLTASRYALRIASAAVLARLISPRDYGLFAMVATLMAFLEVANDLGLSWATVQRRTILRV
ncbi:MAG: oligosaccharide flippase family protein, partial [Bryobacteraceae bacterium]